MQWYRSGLVWMAAAGMVAMAPARAADVGVSISVSQPGVYGRVDIGRFPQPTVVVAQPVWVAPPRVVVAQPEPVYMWVPPGHQKKWSRYCGRYHACGVPVYFVQDGWYRDHVWRRDDRGHGHDDDHDRGRGHGHGHGR